MSTTLVCILIFMYFSKPLDESFGESISHHLPLGYRTMGKFFINSLTNIRDCVFFKIATCPMNEGKTVFIGIFNNWIPIYNVKIINN